MTIILIIVAALIIGFIIKIKLFPDHPEQDISRPSISRKPQIEKDNDKIILINNANYDDVKNALTGFCNMYNNKSYAALPRLWRISSGTFAITFPYDIDFPTYCFAVNYLNYPTGITNWHTKVFAWATTKSGDEWITEKSVNKKVMLFVADDDKEYDNVFLTTEDNIGYKLGFAAGHEKQLLSSPNKLYKQPEVKFETLRNHSFEDIE